MNEASRAASYLGRLGGKASVKKRFENMTDSDRSHAMRLVRLSKKRSTDRDKEVKDDEKI